MIITQTLGDC